MEIAFRAMANGWIAGLEALIEERGEKLGAQPRELVFSINNGLPR
jgi:hypothetical protein